MSRRIAAMVAVHEQIHESRARPLHRAPGQGDRRGLPGDVEIEFELEPVSVERDHGFPIGLIVNEVVSNAFKYAFDDRTGMDGGQAQLLIKDDGPGYALQQAKGDGQQADYRVHGPNRRHAGD